jgi:hypothetical protein
MQLFTASLQAEWMKTRRSAAWWLIISGGLLIPLILLIGRFYNHELIAAENAAPVVWIKLYSRSWTYMGTLLLPMGVILVTSLVAQVEVRNNTWKQLHTVPLPFRTIFLSKLTVILTLLFMGFVLFNLAVFGMITLPAIFYKDVSFPSAPFPFTEILIGNAKFMLDMLPIASLQFLLSLQLRNFLLPIGIGFGLYVASMIGMNWKYGYMLPYIYSSYEFSGKTTIGDTLINFHWLPLVYSLLFTGISFILYLTKKDKT